jgi:hypothetical protein
VLGLLPADTAPRRQPDGRAPTLCLRCLRVRGGRHAAARTARAPLRAKHVRDHSFTDWQFHLQFQIHQFTVSPIDSFTYSFSSPIDSFSSRIDSFTNRQFHHLSTVSPIDGFTNWQFHLRFQLTNLKFHQLTISLTVSNHQLPVSPNNSFTIWQIHLQFQFTNRQFHQLTVSVHQSPVSPNNSFTYSFSSPNDSFTNWQFQFTSWQLHQLTVSLTASVHQLTLSPFDSFSSAVDSLTNWQFHLQFQFTNWQFHQLTASPIDSFNFRQFHLHFQLTNCHPPYLKTSVPLLKKGIIKLSVSRKILISDPPQSVKIIWAFNKFRKDSKSVPPCANVQPRIPASDPDPKRRYSYTHQSQTMPRLLCEACYSVCCVTHFAHLVRAFPYIFVTPYNSQEEPNLEEGSG